MWADSFAAVAARQAISPRGGTATDAVDESAARRLADRYWDEFLALEPLVATEIGDERFDDSLPDRSPHGLARREALHRRALDDLAQIDRHSLDVEGRTALDVVEALAARELASVEYRFDRFDAADHMWGPGTMLAQISSLQRADTEPRLERYVARLASLPRFLAASSDLLADAARARQTSPRLVVDRTIAQVERVLATDPPHSPAINPVPERDVEGRARVEETLRLTVYPAFEGYLGELRRHRAAARESLGLSALPDGDRMYAAKIASWTTLPLEPEAIHEQGMAELERIQDERRRVATELGASDPEAAIAEIAREGRNAFASREELLALAEEQVRRGWEAASVAFDRVPRDNCQVRAVEPSREDDVLEHYLPATADCGRPAVYYVNAKDPAHRLRHSLATTTYHEASPGHHLQTGIEHEETHRPAIRRFAADYVGAAFCEGWGLYAERLADELGLYEDGYERLGMLEMQAFRAARLIVDTGIHEFGWDRTRAIDTMASTGADRGTCELEVDRYVAMPGQALAYTVGKLAIDRLREDASLRLGNGFRLSTFHDRLLSLGSLPLGSLERELSGLYR